MVFIYLSYIGQFAILNRKFEIIFKNILILIIVISVILNNMIFNTIIFSLLLSFDLYLILDIFKLFKIGTYLKTIIIIKYIIGV